MTTTIERSRADANVAVWLNRIRAEYRDMPGLSLTPLQMQRLWGLEPYICAALLEALVAARVLRCTPEGNYVRYED